MNINPEKLIIDYLSSNIDVPVRVETQNPNDKEFVSIEVTGGKYQYSAAVANVNFAVQVYSDTRLGASNLANRVHMILEQIVEKVPVIAKAEVGIPYNFTDNRPRYQMTLEIIMKD